MDGPKKEERTGTERRVPMPEAAWDHEAGPAVPVGGAWPRLVAFTTAVLRTHYAAAETARKVGANDRRRAVYVIKLGVALTLVYILYHVKPLCHGAGGNAVWAVVTVALAFDYTTVGGTVSKGLSGAAGTSAAAVLALGIHWVAGKSGHRFEPYVAGSAVFLLAAAAAVARFVLPAATARYDYGVTAFVLTYGYVAVLGHPDAGGDLPALALQRVSTYSTGIFLCVAVSALVRPVWSGDELRLLTARNTEQLAAAVEACVAGCFASAEPAAAETEDGCSYKRVLDSRAAEDAHASLARWEPPHGRFGFGHPYAQYAEVGAAVRRCACGLDALSSCCVVGVGVQAPGHPARALRESCTRLGAQCARALRDASSCVAAMAAPRGTDSATAEMNAAVRELQAGLRAFPSKLAEEHAEEWLTEAVPLITVASLLIELSARTKGVVDAVHVLATLAKFKPADHD